MDLSRLATGTLEDAAVGVASGTTGGVVNEANGEGVDEANGEGVDEGTRGSSDAEANRLPGRQGGLRTADDNG